MEALANSVSGIQMMGIVGALKTGDPTVDTMIAMAIPVVLSRAYSMFQTKTSSFSWAECKKYWSGLKYRYHRSITHQSTQDKYGTSVNVDHDSCNFTLIRAIQLYLHNKASINLETNAEVDLTSFMIEESSEEEENQACLSKANTLKHYKIIKKMPLNEWHDAGCFGSPPCPVRILLRDNIQDSGQQDSDKFCRCVQMEFVSTSPTAIEALVESAYHWYMGELRNRDKEHRYLYEISSMDAHRSRPQMYTRHQLSDEKTFESLFSEQCRSLVRIIDQFQNKTGKYAVRGYPHKLGLLLHGPPGTGKTSLIKALAHYTGRSIVNVPLARITTNKELANVFSNQHYVVEGQMKSIKLGFKDVIFVMEDVDAASEVVSKRVSLSPHPDSPPTKRHKGPDGNVSSAATTMQLPVGGEGDVASLMAPPLSRSTRYGDVAIDKLDLSGLLNVLDGVVDTPGRMVILSTNHPENLDPALIRPGRIDKMLMLGYMTAKDTISMLEHYFQTKLSRDERRQVESIMSSLEITPARLEQLTAENEDMSSMVAALRSVAKPKQNSFVGDKSLVTNSSEEESEEDDERQDDEHQQATS